MKPVQKYALLVKRLTLQRENTCRKKAKNLEILLKKKKES